MQKALQRARTRKKIKDQTKQQRGVRLSTGEGPQEMKQRAKGTRRRHTRVERLSATRVSGSSAHERTRAPLEGGHTRAERPSATRVSGSSEVLRTRALRLRLRARFHPPALGEGASTSAPGEIKIVSEKHGVKKETPLKNVLQVGILIIYIMGLKLVVGVG